MSAFRLDITCDANEFQSLERILQNQKNELLKQAERADRLADQATDNNIVHTLRDAANDYCHAAALADDQALSNVNLNG